MTLPISPVRLPADLVGQPNGRIPAELLVDVGPSGLLHHTAARAWRALVADAAANGLPLTYTYGGTYRTLAGQTVLFESRYTPGGPGGGCKFYKGTRWCKKSSNLATAAVPGTSNHGIGLAVDSAAGVHPQSATAIGSHPKWSWFRANVERFGFSWELQSEPWHIRYVTGDVIPPAVLAYEQSLTPPPIEGDDDDMAAYIAVPPPERKGGPWLFVSSSVRPATTFDIQDGVPQREMETIDPKYRVEQYDFLKQAAGL
jgi:hypothetical protein